MIEPGIEDELLEEVLVSGLAMVEHRAKRNRHEYGGAVFGPSNGGSSFNGPSNEALIA